MRETIQERQNEEQMLKIQYSARGYYNRAECLGNMAWLCCLLSALSLIIPESTPLIYQLIIPIITDAMALLFSKMQDDSVEKAANFRKYFDAYVLGINDSYKQDEREEIIGDAKEYCEKHREDSNVQISNTGDDTPPGVKDWYDLQDKNEHTSINEVVFECQKQNAWWDERLNKKRITALILISGLLFIILIIMLLFIGNNIVFRVVLSSALIVKSIERIIAEYKYITISHNIDGAIAVMKGEPSRNNIEKLQEYINAKRRCNVVGINRIHKKNAKTLSETYRSRRNY